MFTTQLATRAADGWSAVGRQLTVAHKAWPGVGPVDLALTSAGGDTRALIELKWDPRPAMCVVATSHGYPGRYTTGMPISGIEDADSIPDVKVFHSGTAKRGNEIFTDGGRVLSVTALGQNLAEAQRRAYMAMEKIKFEGMHYRRDIGARALK